MLVLRGTEYGNVFLTLQTLPWNPEIELKFINMT